MTANRAPSISERQSQRAVVQYVRAKYPDVLIWATPNGGSRHKLEAINLKKDGVLAGVPDLFIARPAMQWIDSENVPEYCGLFIEMKSKKGKLSESQIDIIKKLKDESYKCEVCYSADEAIKVIDEYLN